MRNNNFPIRLLSYSILLASLTSSASAEVFSPLPTDITEPANIYLPLADNALRLDVLTAIGTGPCQIGDYSGCTLDDVYNDTNSTDDFKPEVKVHMIMDTFPDDGQLTNATIRQRGNSARESGRKSYRIKLDSKDNLWRGERKLQLNKHSQDVTFINNKLSFDLIQDIPHLTSLRTDFVSMFIDNVDYGLFTHVENVGKEYLTRRGWNKDSGVYKANEFDFFMNEAYALNDQGKPVNPSAFETFLEIKRGKNHSKFLEMLVAVNNESNDFSTDVMDKYFNENNYLTLLSTNILFGNNDGVTTNFYLLNPKGEEIFYFLPWDLDETWEGSYLGQSRAWRGVSGYWSSLFHQRYLQQPGALDDLVEAVTYVKNNYLTADKISSKLDAYFPIVRPFVDADDDDIAAIEEFMSVYNRTYTSVERNYQSFLESLQNPTGFWIDYAFLHEGRLSVMWEPSHDFQGDNITYDIQVSTTPAFTASSIVYEVTGLINTDYEQNLSLPENNYFLRIIARDDASPISHWQEAFNGYAANNQEYFGLVPVQNSTPPPSSIIPTCEMMTYPQTIISGETAEIDWWVEGATSAIVDNGIGSVVMPTEVRLISPTQTTTYTMTAANSGQSTICQITLTVN